MRYGSSQNGTAQEIAVRNSESSNEQHVDKYRRKDPTTIEIRVRQKSSHHITETGSTILRKLSVACLFQGY